MSVPVPALPPLVFVPPLVLLPPVPVPALELEPPWLVPAVPELLPAVPEPPVPTLEPAVGRKLPAPAVETWPPVVCTAWPPVAWSPDVVSSLQPTSVVTQPTAQTPSLKARIGANSDREARIRLAFSPEKNRFHTARSTSSAKLQAHANPCLAGASKRHNTTRRSPPRLGLGGEQGVAHGSEA